MADLPRVFAAPRLPQVGLPRTDRWAQGQAIVNAVGGLAEVAEAMREKQKPIDAARQSSDYDIAVEDLKNEVQADPDPNTWRQNFLAKEAQIRARMLEQTQDPRVKEALNLHIERARARHVIDLTEKGVKASHNKQLADIDTVGNTLAKQAAETSDPGLRQSYINTYTGMVTAAAAPTQIGGRSVPGAITPKDAGARIEKFSVDVLKNRMELLALSQRPSDHEELSVANAKGAFAAVPPDDRARILEKSRTTQEQMLNRIERDKNEVKRLAYQDWSARANFGALTDDELTKALSNGHAFITPDQARTLKSINENPPTGEGGDAVRAIMSEYYLGERSIPRINNTRKKLADLQAALGRPNPLISKAANELQGDQTAVENVDVQRQNRAVTETKELFNATAPALPFNSPLFNNQRKRDEAKAAADARKGVDPKTAVEKALKNQQQRQEAIPQRNKNVMDAVRQ